MKFIQACVGLLAMGIFQARINAQLIQLQHNDGAVTIGAPAEELFWERFKIEFVDSADNFFVDRFRPLKMIRGGEDERVDPFLQPTSKQYGHFLFNSTVSGLREAAVDLPVIGWLADRQGVLAEFLRNTVGSVDEEAVNPLNLAYEPAEYSWWRQSLNTDLAYGIRPFRTDPYAFIGLALRQGETVLGVTNLRYHYLGFADHRFEFALSMPLVNGFSVELGASYQFGQHQDKTRAAFKVFKEFHHGGIVFFGMEARRSPVLSAGITIPL